MVNGKMCVGIVNDDLMVRLAPQAYETALQIQGCQEMGFTGKPIRGFVFVVPDGTATDRQLGDWLEFALGFNMEAKASRKRR